MAFKPFCDKKKYFHSHACKNIIRGVDPFLFVGHGVIRNEINFNSILNSSKALVAAEPERHGAMTIV